MEINPRDQPLQFNSVHLWQSYSHQGTLMPSVYSNCKHDHRGRDGNLSQIFTTFYDFGNGK